MDEELFDNVPFIGLVHNISKNQLKYLNSKLSHLNLGHEVGYIMTVYNNPGCSQDDLVRMMSQSKGNVAKIVRGLEDEGYIEREINPENRRKYMLKTTAKSNELVPKIRQISKDWEEKVGLSEADEELKERIKEISINSMKLIEE